VLTIALAIGFAAAIALQKGCTQFRAVQIGDKSALFVPLVQQRKFLASASSKLHAGKAHVCFCRKQPPDGLSPIHRRSRGLIPNSVKAAPASVVPNRNWGRCFFGMRASRKAQSWVSEPKERKMLQKRHHLRAA